MLTIIAKVIFATVNFLVIVLVLLILGQAMSLLAFLDLVGFNCSLGLLGNHTCCVSESIGLQELKEN